jgi:hypothetical protein
LCFAGHFFIWASGYICDLTNNLTTYLVYIENILQHISHFFSKPSSNVTHIFAFQNHVVERLWVEVNRFVNYPLKTVLTPMVNDDEIDLNDPVDRYVISQSSLELAEIGRNRFVRAWNSKDIPSKKLFLWRHYTPIQYLVMSLLFHNRYFSCMACFDFAFTLQTVYFLHSHERLHFFYFTF